MGRDKDVADGSHAEPGQQSRGQSPTRDSEEEHGEEINQNINQGAAEDRESLVDTSVEMSPQRQLEKSSVNLCVNEREGKGEPRMTTQLHVQEGVVQPPKQHTGGLQSDQSHSVTSPSQDSESESSRLLRELAQLSQQIVVPEQSSVGQKQDISKHQPPTNIADPFKEVDRLFVVPSTSNTATPTPVKTRSDCQSSSQLPSTSNERKEEKGTKAAPSDRFGVEAADDQKPGPSQMQKPEEDHKPGPSQRWKQSDDQKPGSSQKPKPEEDQKPGPTQKRKPEEDQKPVQSQKRKPDDDQKPGPSQKRKPDDKKPGPAQKRKLKEDQNPGTSQKRKPEETKNLLAAAWSELNRCSMYKIYKVLPNYESSSSSEDEAIKHMKSCTTHRRPKKKIYWMSDFDPRFEWEKRPTFSMRAAPVKRKCSDDEESSGSEDGGGKRKRTSSPSPERKRKCTDEESSGDEDEAKRRRT